MSSSESEAENDFQEEEKNSKDGEEKENVPQQSNKTFAELGLVDVLTEACEKVGL